MAVFEQNHPDLLEPIEREEQFFGPPNIGGGKLDNYTKFVLVPAVKDVSDELSESRGSSLYQLLDLIVLRKIELREDIVTRRSEIEDQVKELFDSSNLPELRELGGEISNLLERFFPGAELILDWDEVSVPELSLPTAKSRLIEDGFEGDIDKKGHGLQRALLITLLQYLAQIPIGEEIEVDSRNSEDESSNPEPESLAVRPSLILAIEEPELYLHPLRCKYLSRLLTELAQTTEDNPIIRNQIVFSSHSPHFVDLSMFENIRIMRKWNVPGFPVAEAQVSSFPIDGALQRLVKIAQLDPDKVNKDTFKARIIPVMGSVTNEGFFADTVVLVEGFGDAGLILKLQEILGKDWVSRGIATIPSEGKNKLDRPAIVFQGLGIPVYIVFDGDKKKKGTKEEKNTVLCNQLLLRLLNAPEEDFPKSQVKPTWAVFENDIEQELRLALGEESFNSIREQVASEFGVDRSPQVIKNIHCSSRFIEVVYEEGLRIPILEEIVEAITVFS